MSDKESAEMPDIEKNKPGPETAESYEVDGGYGWVVSFAVLLVTFSLWGANLAFGIYFSYYLNNDTFKGGLKLHYAAIGGISFGIGLGSAPIINYIQGVIGTRPTILIGGLLQFAALMMASYATRLWELYLTQGLLMLYGLALMSMPALTLVNQWFTRRRALGNALAVTGSGLGGLVFNLLLQKIIDVRSYNWAMRAEAIILLALVAIAVCLIRTRVPKKHILFTLYDLDVLRCGGFWILTFYLVTMIFGFAIVLYLLANFTTALGYSASQGAVVAAMIQVGFCLGRPLAGFCAHHWGPVTVAAGSYYLAALFALAMWIPARNYATAIAFGLLEGTVMTAMFPTIAPITGRLVGMKKLNVTFAMSWMFVGIASVFSEIIGVSLTSGSVDPSTYRNTAIFAGCTFFAAGTAMVFLRGYLAARDALEGQSETEMEPFRLKVPVAAALGLCFKWNKRLI